VNLAPAECQELSSKMLKKESDLSEHAEEICSLKKSLDSFKIEAGDKEEQLKIIQSQQEESGKSLQTKCREVEELKGQMEKSGSETQV
jgi:chromosome segregation ATPase